MGMRGRVNHDLFKGSISWHCHWYAHTTTEWESVKERRLWEREGGEEREMGREVKN